MCEPNDEPRAKKRQLTTSFTERRDESNAKRAKITHHPLNCPLPGPSGLINNLNSTNSHISTLHFATRPNFDSDIWKCVRRNYKNMLSQYNIAWVGAQTKTHGIANCRVPFLAAIITDFECIDGLSPVCELKDETGAIQATIAANLYKEQRDYLKRGCVVVCKQVVVLKLRINRYFTITHRNLVGIYVPKKDGGFDEVELQDFPKCEPESSEVWGDAFDGVDLDALLEDF